MATVDLEPRTSRSGVRHSTTEPPRKNESASDAATKCIQFGIKERIWDANFIPTGCSDFHKYLTTRIKNEMNQKRLRVDPEAQVERLKQKLASKKKKC